MKSPALLKIIAVSLAVPCAALLAARRNAAPVPALRDALQENMSADDFEETSVGGFLKKPVNHDQDREPVQVKPLSESSSSKMIASMDLHTHSYCSDGDKSPETLVEEAKESGLTHYALTDHDTTACLARAQAKAKELGIELIPGIEVSAEDDSMHILALGIDPRSPEIAALGEKANVERVARLLAIVKKLPQDKPAGAPFIDLKADVLLPKLNRERLIDGKEQLSLEQASKMAVDEMLSQIRGQITRPDIAKALVAKKWAKNNQDAFNSFLNPGHAAYVPMNGPSFREAIRSIHAAGGIAIWAHPYTVYKFKKKPWVFSGKNYDGFETLAEDMMKAGLDGFQLYTPRSQDYSDLELLEDDTQEIFLNGFQLYEPNSMRFPDLTVPSFVEAYRKKSGQEFVLTPGSDYHGGQDIGPKTMGGIELPMDEFRKVLSRLHLE